MKRASLSREPELSLDARLAQLDVQLRGFEAAIRAQQQSHGRIRNLELELATVVERGAALVRELGTIGDQVRQTAEGAAREALATRVQEFEQRASRILDAYANAVRAAQQAVARAEARIEAFDERVAHELADAGREIREAAQLLRDRTAAEAAVPVPQPTHHVRRLIPALLAALLLLAGFGAYTWVARMIRDTSARADAAERQAIETRRQANQQIASIERTAQQASSDALSAAARAERTVNVLAAPDAKKAALFGRRRAPGATGQAFWSASRGLVITAAGLPALSASETYQVWLTTDRDVVTLGFLTPDALGRATGTFDLPPTRAAAIHGFMVTREPAGGRPQPSRTVVLASWTFGG